MKTPSEKTLEGLKALGDAHRLRILEVLGDGRKCVRDLTDAMGCGQALVSFHLRILLEAGLIELVPEGRFHCYAIRSAGLEELDEELRVLGDRAAAAEACCARVDAPR